MKTIRFIYKQGRLINTENGNQVQLKHGMSYDITGLDKSFIEKEPKDQLKPLDKEEKLLQLKKMYKNNVLFLIAQTGTVLKYKLNHPDEYEEENIGDIYYRAVLQEDLYFFHNSAGDWNLCPCICLTDKEISGKNPLKLFEPIRGNSLSNLFNEMVTTFYAHLRTPGTNAFKTFSIYDSSNHFHNLKLEKIRDKLDIYMNYLRNDRAFSKNDNTIDKKTLKTIEANFRNHKRE